MKEIDAPFLQKISWGFFGCYWRKIYFRKWITCLLQRARTITDIQPFHWSTNIGLFIYYFQYFLHYIIFFFSFYVLLSVSFFSFFFLPPHLLCGVIIVWCWKTTLKSFFKQRCQNPGLIFFSFSITFSTNYNLLIFLRKIMFIFFMIS